MTLEISSTEKALFGRVVIFLAMGTLGVIWAVVLKYVYRYLTDVFRDKPEIKKAA